MITIVLIKDEKGNVVNAVDLNGNEAVKLIDVTYKDGEVVGYQSKIYEGDTAQLGSVQQEVEAYQMAYLENEKKREAIYTEEDLKRIEKDGF